MSFPDLIHSMVMAYPGKVNALAARMKKNPKVLASKINPNCATHGLNADELEQMMDLIDGNADVARYFADKANLLVIPMIDFDGSDMQLLDGTAELMKEIGDFFDVFRKAYADGRIDMREWKRIQKEGIDVQAKMATLMNRISQMVDDRPALRAVEGKK